MSLTQVPNPALVVLVLLSSCATPPSRSAQTLPTAFDLSNYRLVDLSHAYGAETLYWPTSPSAFELTELANGSDEGYFYSAYSYCSPEHGGTHMDAPVHFFEEGLPLGDIPLTTLIAPAIVIDVQEKTENNSDYRLTRQDVLDWESQHGEIANESVVLLRTGWSRYWPNAKNYLGDDTKGDASNLHFPSYGEDAARLLVDERRVAMIGVDTASIDYGPTTDFVVHRIASAQNVPALENVGDLSSLPTTGAWVIALPMKIEAGSGGPVRIVALVP